MIEPVEIERRNLSGIHATQKFELCFGRWIPHRVRNDKLSNREELLNKAGHSGKFRAMIEPVEIERRNLYGIHATQKFEFCYG
jgi:hypothetical protein